MFPCDQHLSGGCVFLACGAQCFRNSRHYVAPEWHRDVQQAVIELGQFIRMGRILAEAFDQSCYMTAFIHDGRDVSIPSQLALFLNIALVLFFKLIELLRSG